MKSEKSRATPTHSTSDEPATQHDLELLGGQLTNHITTVENNFTERIDQLEEKMASKEELAKVRDMQERTLQIVESIDQHFKIWKQLPHDVELLKADVTVLKMKG